MGSESNSANKEASQHQHVLAEYDRPFLDVLIGIVTSAVIVGYTLYTLSSETIARFLTDKLLLTVPIVCMASSGTCTWCTIGMTVAIRRMPC